MQLVRVISNCNCMIFFVMDTSSDDCYTAKIVKDKSDQIAYIFLTVKLKTGDNRNCTALYQLTEAEATGSVTLFPAIITRLHYSFKLDLSLFLNEL